ncbi:MAG: TetR/AcrR family transcriptional regulator [Christensenellales bacterium]
MKKQQKTELSRERIINAAINEFGTNGYKKGALNNICATGIAKGLMYHNFRSKEQLYLETVRVAYDSFIAYVHQNCAADDFDKYMAVRVKFMKEQSKLCRIMFEALIQPPYRLEQQIKEIRREFDMLNDKLYFAMIDKLSLRDGVEREKASKYFHIVQDMFNGYFGNMLMSGESVESIVEKHEQILPEFIDLMLHGIVVENK